MAPPSCTMWVVFCTGAPVYPNSRKSRWYISFDSLVSLFVLREKLAVKFKRKSFVRIGSPDKMISIPLFSTSPTLANVVDAKLGGTGTL